MTPKIFIVLLSGVLTCACCREEYIVYEEVSVSLVPLGSSFVNPTIVDTLREPFHYTVRLIADQLAATPAVRWEQVLMAFSCEENYDRTLVDSLLTVSLDRSFTYNGAIIPPGTDLIPILDASEDKQTFAYPWELGVDMQFGAAFLKLASFAPGTYTFTFEGMLTDDTPVAAATPVYLELP